MALIFRYKHIPRPDGSLKSAPFIPIKARSATGKLLTFYGLVDSGADSTVIPKDMAEVLGMKEEGPNKDTGGIGGKVKVKNSRFKFQIGAGREKYPLNVPALVLQDIESDMPPILGRHGFFEEFHITFRQNEEKILLKKIQPVKKY